MTFNELASSIESLRAQYEAVAHSIKSSIHFNINPLPPLHEIAFRYAKEKGPCDETREAACTNAYYAYCYALEVDEGPHDDTRAAACRNEDTAYWYAHDVDRVPRDDTREAASRDPHWKRRYERAFPRSIPTIASSSDTV